jgi:hypothetical protein
MNMQNEEKDNMENLRINGRIMLTSDWIHEKQNKAFREAAVNTAINCHKIRGATALTNLGRVSSRRWQSFPTAPDGTGLTCGQHIEHHSCIFSFPNRTVTSSFK